MLATYRLQLHPDFGFSAVESLLPYFSRLGISHLYLSPITEARPGSMHGYDVIDHNAVRTDLGGREGFERLLEAARSHGLGIILDFVPNHAGVGPHNASWQDVLAYGPHSPYAPYFDIDWQPIKPELHGKVLLPFLGGPYGEILDKGELRLVYENGFFYAAYYDQRYPLNPATYAAILQEALPGYERTEVYWDLKDLNEAYAHLAPDEREKAERLRTRLIALAEHLDLNGSLEAFRGERLHELLERQYWRLAYWKTANYEINYRRFFNINELVALRMEDEQVFWDAHRLLGELLARDGVDGVRIDHVDGLFDPHRYLEHLHELGAEHIWTEKILAHGEQLPEAWPVEGTTGYEFMNDVMGVLLQSEGEAPLERTYLQRVPGAQAYEEEAHRSKVVVMESSLSSELFRLTYELDRISEADYHTRDFTLGTLREALREMVAAFDRYRTYLPHEPETARAVIDEVIRRARQRNPTGEPLVYAFIARVILGEVRQDLRDLQRAWVGRFQQYTAPVAAKGVEDTLFYRYLRLVALNEVGGEPGHFGTPVETFHEQARVRADRYPRNLLATATHDHKRGEDTRMRLIALAEIPDRWAATARTLSEIAADHRSPAGPTDADAYLFFQTLVALWHGADHDTLPDRLVTYMQKATRESKRKTSWLNPDADYEQALERFVRGVVADERTRAALEEPAALLARYGFFNTLSQVVLKMTTPGVPDIYQSCELLDLTLVDPDNRSAVDYAARQKLLDEIAPLLDAPDPEALRQLLDEGAPRLKLYFIARLLQLRKARAQLFSGAYTPLDVTGAGRNHWIAFMRAAEQQDLIVLVPRFPATWPDHRQALVTLPESYRSGTWQDVLSGETIQASATIDTSTLPLPWAVLQPAAT